MPDFITPWWVLGLAMTMFGLGGLGALFTLRFVFGPSIWWGVEETAVDPADPYPDSLRGTHT